MEPYKCVLFYNFYGAMHVSVHYEVRRLILFSLLVNNTMFQLKGTNFVMSIKQPNENFLCNKRTY